MNLFLDEKVTFYIHVFLIGKLPVKDTRESRQDLTCLAEGEKNPPSI